MRSRPPRRRRAAATGRRVGGQRPRRARRDLAEAPARQRRPGPPGEPARAGGRVPGLAVRAADARPPAGGCGGAGGVRRGEGTLGRASTPTSAATRRPRSRGSTRRPRPRTTGPSERAGSPPDAESGHERALAAAGLRAARPPWVRMPTSAGRIDHGASGRTVWWSADPAGRPPRAAYRDRVGEAIGPRQCVPVVLAPCAQVSASAFRWARELVTPPTYGGPHGARHPSAGRPVPGHQRLPARR